MSAAFFCNGRVEHRLRDTRKTHLIPLSSTIHPIHFEVHDISVHLKIIIAQPPRSFGPMGVSAGPMWLCRTDSSDDQFAFLSQPNEGNPNDSYPEGVLLVVENMLIL